MSSSTAPELCSVRRPEEPQTSADLSEPASQQPEKKKRRSADAVALGVTQEQAKYERASLGDGSGSSRLLTGSKARVDPQQAYPSMKKRAKTGAQEKWAEHIEWKKWKKSSSLEVCSKTGAILSITWNRDGEGVRDPLSPGSAKRRKFAVQFLFSEVFGSPKELEWAAPNFHLRLSLPRIIMDMLDVPSKSKEAVIIAMRAMSKAHETGVEYDPSREIKAGRGAKILIKDYTPQADVVYRTMESGMSLGNAMVVLNQWRRAKKMTPSSISYGCLQRFVKHSPVIVLEKRETVKAGSADEETVWAGARWSFAKQVKRQLRKGARIAAGGAGTIYKDKPPGNSPENARGLDSYGFADLEYAMCFNCALSWVYPYDDPRRIFGQGTPKEVWHLMRETWTVVGAPSNARITEDISGWERVCDKIIEAKGAIVLDENFRTGRRARKMHGEGDRKTKLRKRDRKSTHLLELPVHPALKGAYAILMGLEG